MIITDKQLTEEIIKRVEASEELVNMHAVKMSMYMEKRRGLTRSVIDMVKKDDFSCEMLVEISKEIIEIKKRINDFLAVDYDEDLPYTDEQFLEDLRRIK